MISTKLYSSVPRHVAIIMDGNGRWAKQHSLPRSKGHQAGAKSVESVLRACKKADIKYLTLYAFSTENWVRPKSEVDMLMNLLARFLERHESSLHKEQIRLRVIGQPDALPDFVRSRIRSAIKATENYEPFQLILALNYGARDEIVRAVRKIAGRVKDETLDISAIDEAVISSHLDAPDVPDPDLMIRTSGEMRISNFMLWQLSYTELYVTDTLWPDFGEDEFFQAIDAYARRHRRFGDA